MRRPPPDLTSGSQPDERSPAAGAFRVAARLNRHPGAVLYLAGLLGILIAGFVAFSELGGTMFFSWDSASQVSFANEALANGTPFSIGPSYSQSLGNIAFPIDYWLMPDYRLAYHDGRVEPVVFYLVAAGLFFTCAFAMAMLFGFGPWVAAISAAAFALSTLPYSSPALLTELFWWHAPFMIPLVYMAAPLMAFFYLSGRLTGWRNLIPSALLAVTVLWVVAAYPKLSAVVFLGAAVFCLIFLIAAETRRELAWKLAAGAVLAALFLSSGPWQFMRGIYGYTGNFLFLETMKAGGGIDWRNLLLTMFHPPSLWIQYIPNNMVWVKYHMGYVLPAAAMVGAVWTAISPRWPRAAKLLAIGMFVTLPFSFLSVYGSGHPAQVYYLLFLLALVPFADVAVGLARRLSAAIPTAAARMPAVAFASCAAGLGLAVLTIGVSLPRPAKPAGYPYPPSDGGLAGFLTTNLAFGQGDAFRGRFLNLMLTAELDRYTEVNHINTTATAMLTTGYRLAQSEGNDLTFAGLRYFDVPVTVEYNRMTTPFSATFQNYLLVRDGDHDRIDYRTITRFDPRLLALIGVRFVLAAHQPLGSGAKLVDGSPLKADGAARLYEIEGSNRGQYSPTRLTLVERADDALRRLADPDFDPRAQALIHAPLPERRLVPPGAVEISRIVNGIRIVARAPGTSFVVLPFEFSHCYRVHADAGQAPLRIVRVNLFQTGMLFEKSARFDLRFEFGPFTNESCRLRDLDDVRAMRLSHDTLKQLGAGSKSRLNFGGLH